jgi:hypothetical protein
MRARLGVIPAAVLLAALVALAQRFGGGIRHGDEGPRPEFPSGAEYHFIRTEYTDLPQFHRGFGFASRGATGDGWWMVDWPDADEHFSMGVRRLTRIHTGDPRHLRLTDPNLFDYPWIYATQAGWWGLSDAEIKCLREFLLRGGYLVVDDFWGPEQWEIFPPDDGPRVPNRPIVDLAHSDAVLHVLYDIEGRISPVIPAHAPSAPRSGGGITVQQPEGTAPWRSIFDDHNRIGGRRQFQYRRGRCVGVRGFPDYPGP